MTFRKPLLFGRAVESSAAAKLASRTHKLFLILLAVAGTVWALIPYLNAALDSVADPGWCTVIRDLYPPPLLDQILFEDRWQLAETVLRASLVALLLAGVAIIVQAIRRTVGNEPLGDETIELHSPSGRRVSHRIALAALIPALLILAPATLFFSGINTAEKEIFEQQEERRLHPLPRPMTRTERDACGSVVSGSLAHLESGYVFQYELTGTNTLCPVHRTPLQHEGVPMLAGLASPPGGILFEAFPYGRLAVSTGCIVGRQTEVSVLRCSNCVALNERFSGTTDYYLRQEWKQQRLYP